MSKIIFCLLLILLLLLPERVMADEFDKPVIGLALSSGAAWGLAHIGVLEVLAENDIEFELVAGTSAGAIIGAFYAGGTTPHEMEDIVAEMSWLDILRPIISKNALFRSDVIEKFIASNLKINSFAELPVKLSVVAADLATGETVILNEGVISQAVTASSAIPVVFEPVYLNDKVLIDGGMANNLPVDVVKEMGADIIIAVNVSGGFSFKELPQSKIETGIRAYHIMQKNMVNNQGADILIEPDLDGISGIDFEEYEILIEKGREAAEAALPDILQLLGR